MSKQKMTRTSVREELYFHTGNSGITARVLECARAVGYANDDGEPAHDYSWRLEFEHGAMGHRSTMSQPILHREMVDHYIAMLERLRDRMDDPAARSYHKSRAYDHNHRVVQIKSGCTVEEVWTPEIVVSRCSTASRLLGHNIRKDGKVIEFEPYTGPIVEMCSNGTADRYDVADIGMPVANVKRNDPNISVTADGDVHIVGDVAVDRDRIDTGSLIADRLATKPDDQADA